MKKVFLAVGIIAFLIAGAVSIESVNANTVDKVVYDDPPKAEKKNSKSCASYSKSTKCCSSKAKTASASKSECSDKKDTKTASTTTAATSTTKKDSPDKK